MRRWLCVYYLNIVLIQMCIVVVVHGVKLRTWKVHRNCGFRISEGRQAGTIVFSVKELQSKLGYTECKLIVVPETLPGSHGNGKVFIYFTDFELPGTCSDFSVILLDGSLSNAPRVTGLPDPLCQHNTSLTKTRTVFNTSGTEFTALFRWRNTESYKSGYVIFKFSSYYEGPCSDDVITCVNKLCTSSAYHCRYGIDTCGPEEETVCEKKMGGFGDGLGRMVIALVIMVIVLGGAGFLCTFCNHCARGIWRCMQSCRKGRTSRNVQNRARSTPPSTNTYYRQQRERPRSPHIKTNLNQQRARSRSPSTCNDFRQQRERPRSPSSATVALCTDTRENSLHEEHSRSQSINTEPKQQRVPLSKNTMQIVPYQRVIWYPSPELSRQSSPTDSLYLQASEKIQLYGEQDNGSIISGDLTDDMDPPFFDALTSLPSSNQTTV